MKVQRILEITRRDATKRIAVGSAIEMFSLLHDDRVKRVEMVWDSILGEKRMTFKDHDLRDPHRLSQRPKPPFSRVVRTVHCGRRPRRAK